MVVSAEEQAERNRVLLPQLPASITRSLQPRQGVSCGMERKQTASTDAVFFPVWISRGHHIHRPTSRYACVNSSRATVTMSGGAGAARVTDGHQSTDAQKGNPPSAHHHLPLPPSAWELSNNAVIQRGGRRRGRGARGRSAFSRGAGRSGWTTGERSLSAGGPSG